MDPQQLLKLIDTSVQDIPITIPGKWLGLSDHPIRTGHKRFLISCLERIMENKGVLTPSHHSGHWTERAIVYNLFVRLFSAYDHDQDGRIGDAANDTTLNKEGIRETGTFMKAMALLPYLKSLGINTIQILPITTIGVKGRKGDLGSPYAIKNPLKIDTLMADPMIPLSVEEQYKWFIELAHYMGMRVVQEFIFRTASIDSDWIETNPNWFYWIKSKSTYAPPEFSPADLKEIMKIPSGKGKFIPPPAAYRSKFVRPFQEENRKTNVVASAFADWPPNDLQPPWSDVTYLRMYNYDYAAVNNFNYIAYNTIRFYDPQLAKKDNINLELWEHIAGIIPYYQHNFGIDGAMIDMGHALPEGLKRNIIGEARKIDPHFGFWDENFRNTERTKSEGYNAVVGGAWHLITKRNGFKKLLTGVNNPVPLCYFGGAETHNTPRFGYRQIRKKEAAWLLFQLLPNAMPFLHNGFELHEHLPVNTGLNFTKKQIAHYSTQPLPLFYKNKLNWDTRNHLITFIRRINWIRREHSWIFNHSAGRTISVTGSGKVHGLVIRNKKKEALVIFNLDFQRRSVFTPSATIYGKYENLMTGEMIDIVDTISISRGGIILAIRN